MPPPLPPPHQQQNICFFVWIIFLICSFHIKNFALLSVWFRYSFFFYIFFILLLWLLFVLFLLVSTLSIFVPMFFSCFMMRPSCHSHSIISATYRQQRHTYTACRLYRRQHFQFDGISICIWKRSYIHRFWLKKPAKCNEPFFNFWVPLGLF